MCLLLAGARATYLYESMCDADDGVCFSIKDKAQYSMQLAEAIAAGEYYLLPLACELICAPLPGEWREVMVDGAWKFREGATDTLHDLHPLTETFLQLVALERRWPHWRGRAR